jgi:hypothetical protein
MLTYRRGEEKTKIKDIIPVVFQKWLISSPPLPATKLGDTYVTGLWYPSWNVSAQRISTMPVPRDV